MTSKLEILFKNHQIWVDSSGRRGCQLNLDDREFMQADINSFQIEQSVLTACHINQLTFDKSDFYLAALYSCDFLGTSFNECSFYKCTLDYCNMTGAHFTKCKFGKAEIYQSDFRNAYFQNCSFVDSNFIEANLRNCCLENIDFKLAYLKDVKIAAAKIINPINLEQAVQLTLDVSETDEPHILSQEESLQWIKKHAEIVCPEKAHHLTGKKSE